ncbi:hypothetical protein BCR33DRAFT_182403 [Rhizoclosmatium globosum]|uniref:TPR-like protein n=1 Tax=Rhizoclosmatium globosum TaxID=329046 RepID=A0A1Y2D1G3_9FUNG|nr:hypothetical protein BCR33DRAFT_182403 [Rhizoclosmatium globosum]|eukprot:ORY52956.1 hypothetical protein BCR33DRAFT_182403 [Rhizoclosmatium globosum]
MQKLVVNLLNAGQTQDAVMYGEMVYCKSVEWFGENDLRLVQAFKKLEWNFTTAAQLDKVSLILLNVMERKLIQSKAHDVRPLAAPIEHKSEPESADTAFSLLGVKLEFFDYFIDKVCGGVENVQGLSTTEVNIKYLQPLTSESKISLCRLYEKSPLIDKATVFVSHAWKFDFLDVVDALKTHAQNNSLGPDTTFWFDLFSNSQHDTATKPFSFWTGTFMTAIKAIGSVVMIMLPWEDPIPLQRAWCIYELYACMETRSEFNVAMPRAERKRFLSQVNVKSFNKMLASVKSENSTSFLPDDKEKIHTAIRDSIGFTNLDSAMFKVLKEWMLKALKMELQLAESVLGKTNPLSLTLKAGLAGVYGDLGNEEASLLLYQELWDYYKTNVGVDSGFALIHCGNVISSLITLKRFSEAKAPALDLIERSRQIFGNEHQSTCSAKESLAVVLENEAKFAEALALHNDTLQVYLGLYGDESEHTARAKLSLASCYYTMKDFQKASDAYQAAFDTRKRLLGEDHPSTLGTMTSLGSALYLAGRVEESRSLQKECLDKCRRVLGDSHPSTINVANNYAATMDAQDSSSKNDRLELLQLVYSQAIESHGTSSLQIATPLMNLAIEISNTDIQKR